MENAHKKNNMIFALFVLFFTMITYLCTVAPTVAFWDCGEYIGASHSLAIPHPPGNPLYVMIGRVFSIIFFFFNQVAYRVNLISILSASFTAMLIYLIVVRAMISWMGIPDARWKRVTVYLSGIVGAFFCAFGYTFWFSSVEASVYIPSMFVVALCTWVAIVWSQSKDPDRDRILILFAYIAFLGIAIHMMSMLALIPVFLFILISDESKLKDWRLWITCLAMGTVIYQVSWFFLLGPLTVVLTLVISLMGNKIEKKKWRFCFWIAFFALLGYSVHFYIPIRSSACPIIDENHPVIRMDDETGKPNWDAFKYFLERKQYGSESMITRMFWPLARRTTQFGIDGHMGYGGFHMTQFFHFGRSVGIDRNDTVFKNWGGGGIIRLLLYMIPTILMIYGWFYLYKRNRNMAILLIFLFLIGSVILVFYMNFADGTRPMKRDYQMWVQNQKQGPMPVQHREVRIRDYFFTSGFMFFGMWIGIAFGCILHSLFTSKNQFMRTQLAPIMAVLIAVSPALPFSQNVVENSRRNDWVPYDYAYNLLMSCEKDGLLFTNGDNDTFPLWFLQEAEGIRRDVRIVNLSLLNTKWYIKQLKNFEPKVPISYSERDIDNKLIHKLNPLEKAITYKMPKAGLIVQLPGRDTKRALKVQDQMVVNIVDSNKWKKPVYFAVTVSSDNLMGLQPYLQMQGLVYRVMTDKVSGLNATDMDRSLFLLNKVYKFRGLGDGSVPISETSLKLVSNYAASFIQAVISTQQSLEGMKKEISTLETSLQGDSTISNKEEKGIELAEKKRKYEEKVEIFKPIMFNKLDQCIGLMPWNWRVRLLQQNILMEYGRTDLALEKIEQAQEIEPGKKEYLQQEARLHYMNNDKSKANELLMKLADSESDPWQAYAAICQNFEEEGLYDSAIMAIEKFQLMYPGDTRATNMLKRLNMMKEYTTKKNIDSVKSDSSKKVEIKG